MPVMDEFREERQAMKQAPLKQKCSYFWLYYKWHVIIGISAIIIITSFIHTALTRKETALYTMMVNIFAADQESQELYRHAFMEAIQMDTEEYDVVIDSSHKLNLNFGYVDETTYGTIEKINTYIAVGEVDLFASDAKVFKHYAYMDDFFADLRDVLTPEQIEKYSPYFYYVDWKIVTERSEASANLKEYILPDLDHTKPETMTDPVPVGILLDNTSEAYKKTFLSASDTFTAIGFVITGSHPENAQLFIDHIFTETE